MLLSWMKILSATLVASSMVLGSSVAQAQLFGNMFNQCNVCATPVQQVAYDPCALCNQQQVVYRQVPVTEYRQVKQTVRKPIVETAYEDRQVTEYRTVYEQKTAEIPTVSYQNVTEYRTVSQDRGYWQTYRQPIARMSPCAYDSSPTLLGALNRAGYSMRTAFSPSYKTHRTYQPNVVTAQVPYTRQVAIRGSRTVNYQVAKLVPQTTTKRVAVNRVRYENQETVQNVPVTVYRSVPIGTQTAYGFVPYQSGGTTTALAPTPDPTVSAKKVTPTEVPKRTAEQDSKFKAEPIKKSSGFNAFPQGSIESQEPQLVTPASYETVSSTPSPASSAKPAVPSMIRVSGWRARASEPEIHPSPVIGPDLSGPTLHVADATH